LRTSTHWRLLTLAIVAQITVSIVTQGVPTLAPFLQADLALTRGKVGMFNSALMAGTFVVLFFAGWLVDVKGERAALVWGNVIVGITCIAILLTHSFYSALGMFFLAGVGAAFATPAGSKTVTRWFPPVQRGTAMGLRQTGIPIGGALAAAILPFIALSYGWRWAIVASGVASLLAGLLCALRYPPPAAAERASAHAAPAYGFRDLLTRDIALIGVAGALLPLGQFALVTYLALYLKETQQIPITASAMLLVGAQLAGACGRLLWGVWSDRVFAQQRKPALLAAGMLSAIGSLVLGWIPTGTPLWAIWLIVLAYAFNAIGWHGSWIALVAEIAGPEKQGRTIGVAMTIMYAGIIVLPPLFGTFVDYTHHWSGAWTILAGGLLMGTALIAPIREPTSASRELPAAVELST
jgi:MFS family permease